jgi:protoheme IX farnesyltransferase
VTAPSAFPASGPSALPVGALADWRDYLALLKPRVMTLVVFTGLCGLLAAPGTLHPVLAFTAILCIAVGAGAAGAFNQWYERDVDALMKRTASRPLPAGRVCPDDAFAFAMVLAVGSVLLMGVAVNWLAAGVLAGSILFYVLIYTLWLKRRTPQNIVIGGAAGAFPPLIGWIAVTGEFHPLPWILFAIIFLWTPPHFWALSLFVKTDYAKAGIPMLPVVAGEPATRRQIWLYSWAMLVASVLPWPLGYLGALYGLGATALGLIFLAGAWSTLKGEPKAPKLLFGYSVLYLFALFALVVVDHYAGGAL